MALRALLLSIVAMMAFALSSCSSGSDPSIEAYTEEMASPLEEWTDALDAWNASADELADTDFTSISSVEYRRLLENNLNVAREAQVATKEALAEVRVIVPPEACDEIHEKLIESLRLTEQGFLEIVSYQQASIVSGEGDEAQGIRGNELLADAALTKEEVNILWARAPDCF